ncbi:ABC transporter ATP-binding protein [Lichenibacterium dinghuense]|uniref:ABC transporter ATP-binding protein n=1 Tax=Lichenibacterium dinghuense TaxID=2895977 RepID=UPI001F380D47|nr:ABC transporter ATP-binding protein [Lichenibacterium sp. 6Y81]
MSAAASAADVLVADGVGRSFGRFVALKGVSASFRRCALTSIIGPNGAGKSTLFNVLSGGVRPTSGRILFEGNDITGLPQHRFARLGIAKSFQITNVFPRLSAFENVRVVNQALASRFDLWRARARLTGPAEEAEALLHRVGLWHRRHEPAAALAHGEQRALEIGMALASRPRLLLLDEPTAGMSPEETRATMGLIVSLAEERTVILVEHKMKLVMAISHRLLVLHHGEVLAEGTPDEIRRDETVRRVYLGERAA